jgi:hypothetical protein
MPSTKELNSVTRIYAVKTHNETRVNGAGKKVVRQEASDLVGVTPEGKKVCVGFESRSTDYRDGSVFEQTGFNRGDSKDSWGLQQVRDLKGKVTEPYSKRGVDNWSEHRCKPSSLK